MGRIIYEEKGIVVSTEVKDLEALEKLVEQTCDIEGISGYKLGAVLTIRHGLPKLVDVVRKHSDLPTIYDHQKGMTDIPDIAKYFLTGVKDSGVNAFIGFPHTGPAVQEAWINAGKEIGLEIIIGGEMTHQKYKHSEGGYISDESLDGIYMLAAKLGINNFVVPGNKPDRIKHYLDLLTPIVKEKISLWSPGFVAQGGLVADAVKVAGESFYPIVGRGIYEAKDMRAAAKELAQQILEG